MIQFPCTCGHVFSVEDDEAGGFVQCPACRRLNDIPSYSDIQNLAEDGTFKLNEPPVAPAEPDRVDELAYVFRKSRVDEAGEDIDLRTTPEDLSPLDLQPRALEPGEVRRHTPQYDPETGELIRPLDVKPDPARDFDPLSVPMAKQVSAVGVPVIEYARVRGEAPTGVSLGAIPRELFRPPNLVVMACIFIVHVFLNLVLLTALTGLLVIVAAIPILIALLLAHYGNVIDEIGREEVDELPRPLRQMNWLDDLWSPFTQVAGSFMICFLPALFAVIGLRGAFGSPVATAGSLLIALGLAAGGAVMFPAVLVTLATSGSVLNLRPDRLIGVIRATGRTYPVTVVFFIAAVLVYGCGLIGTFYNLIVGVGILDSNDLGPVGRAVLAYPLVAIGIYLAHLFCWRVGLTYRARHAAFPWILQRFEKAPTSPAPLTEADRAVMRRNREARLQARQQLSRQSGP